MYGFEPRLCVMYGMGRQSRPRSGKTAAHSYFTHDPEGFRSYFAHGEWPKFPYITHGSNQPAPYITQRNPFFTQRNPYFTQPKPYITHSPRLANRCAAKPFRSYPHPKSSKTPKSYKNPFLVITSEDSTRCVLITNPARGAIPNVQPLRSTLTRSPA